MDNSLGFGFVFKDLYDDNSLRTIDKKFLSYVSDVDSSTFMLLSHHRRSQNISRKEYAHLIDNLAKYLEGFFSQLFKIEQEVDSRSDIHKQFRVTYNFKRNFVQRKVLTKYRNYDFAAVNIQEIESQIERHCENNDLTEERFINLVNTWLVNPDLYEKEIERAELFIAWHCLFGKSKNSSWLIFKYPKKKDYEDLVKYKVEKLGSLEILKCDDEDLHHRDGFNLTDSGGTLEDALDQANYCIFCHKQERDSCSRGAYDNKKEVKNNPLGEKLTGCPLDEKISEMNELKSQGMLISALAVAVIDNPMLAATGYRICNDCMKSCIYQKQDPVNIPKVETRVLRDVLDLPWGFEIYSLLTRWNPLNIYNPYPKKFTGKNVLVVGMGPAGFTLAHYLLNQGHAVVGIDGLKIEPLSEGLSGADFMPITNIKTLYEELEQRKSYGFGGVTEYGITVRWDKNFLTIIRMILERRKYFRLFGGIRFGGNIDRVSAFNMGFDHIALAIGAGRPNILSVPNALALGVRTASDFLMSLQSGGAGQKDSITNLQIRLPLVVIGGGLTAIDTATEARAYYIRQVEKLYDRYTELCSRYGKEFVEETWLDIDKSIAAEFFEHANMIKQERNRAKKNNTQPDFNKIISSLGGVRVLYRKSLQSSPSYRLNHEELELALKEGIEFIENVVPTRFITDEHGYIDSIVANSKDEEININTKTVLMAIGTHPNITLSKEDTDVFSLDGRGYFKFCDSSKDGFSVFKDKEGRGITVFGDLHPKYKGNVVKAMASAKDGFKVVDKQLKDTKTSSNKDFLDRIEEYFTAKVVEVKELSKGIIEVIIKSPSAAQNFYPGQFYRLQNYESQATLNKVHKTKLVMEGIAVTGAWVNKDKSLLSTVVLEMGGSSSLCRHLSPGSEVVLMGPTGTPTEIHSGEVVALVGGGLGNAVLFSIGKAFRDKGSKVIYFAGYRNKDSLFMQDEVEQAADEVVWCCDSGTITPRRDSDTFFNGNVVDAITQYSKGNIPNMRFDLSSVNRMIVIGSDNMMRAVQNMRLGAMKDTLAQSKAISSINSPMQCMMKEICAQCLQRHVDPLTGIESYVYSCTNQDQDMNMVDFKHLGDRLKQNSLQEKITAKWLYHCLRE